MTKTEMKLKIIMFGVSGIGMCKRYRETQNRAKDLFVSGLPWVGERGSMGENTKRESVNGYSVWQKV